MRLDHIAYRVADRHKTVEFFCQSLGYSVSEEFKVDFDDAKQECFMLSIKVLKNFTREKGSAFNYFTTVIVNNLKLIYTKNKKYQEKMQQYKDKRIKAFLEE